MEINENDKDDRLEEEKEKYNHPTMEVARAWPRMALRSPCCRASIDC